MLNLDKNALYLLLGKILLPEHDWKAALQAEGAAVVQGALRELWKRRLRQTPGVVASSMEDEGWSWEAVSNPDFLAAQKVRITAGEETLGPGFLISRDALYALLKATGLPGGAVRDAFRDAYDNAVYLDALATHGADFSAETPLLTLVELTRDALIDTVL